MTTRVLLRGVSLDDTVKKYMQNGYSKLNEPAKKVNCDLKEKEISKACKENVKCTGLVETKNETGKIITCLNFCINEKGNYQEYGQSDGKYNCMYCLMNIKKDFLGIPIYCEIENDKRIYYCIDIFCNWSCWYAEAQIRLRLFPERYSNSIHYMCDIYETTTGKKFSELKASNNKYFLKIFNGPMDYETFHATAGTYTKPPSNYIFRNTEQIYEKEF